MISQESKTDFSVIVLCYNSDIEKLKKTVYSILRQVDVSLEIIISDDGSAESGEALIRQFFDELGYKNVKFNFLTENRGTVGNILSAIELCLGEYVKLISPGDYLFDEHSLFHYKNTFSKHRADIVFGRAQYFTQNEELLKLSSPKNTVAFHNRSIKRNVLCYHDYILGASIASEKNTLKEYLNRVVGKIRFLEDVSLTFLALLDGKKIVACNKHLIWYEYGTGISTNTNIPPRLQSDYSEIYRILSEYKSRAARISVRFYNMEKSGNRLTRILKKILISPSYIFYLFGRLFYKNRKVKRISQMERIIQPLTEVE